MRRVLLCALALAAATTGLGGCGGDVFQIGAEVAPLPGEDLAGPCRFGLILAPAAEQRGVLVLYQRGDTEDLLNDRSLRSAAAQMQFAIVWAEECDARSTGDLQAEASAGPARMLFAALSQLAGRTGHPELATARMVLYGFSAAGVLAATMANEYPERLLGTVQYASGSEYLDLDDVAVTAGAAEVPALILANAADDKSGTSRSHRFFERGREKGAVWAYGVQRYTGHCCTLSTRDVLLPWMQAVVGQATEETAETARGAATAGAATGYFLCTPDGVEDTQDETDCSFTQASLTPEGTAEETAWLPDGATAAAWLRWVTSPGTN